MLEEYRREYEEFNTQWMREYYLVLSGQKADLELARIYERYGDLFTLDAVSRLKQLLDEASPNFETTRASVDHLLNFATDQYLENAAKVLTEEISRYEAQASIEWQGQEITFQDAYIKIRTEGDRAARRELYKKRLAVIEASNDLRAERLGKLYRAAHTLGFAHYAALYEQLRHQDYVALGTEVQKLLDQTEAVYVTNLDTALRRDLNIRIEEAERSDAMYFLNLSEYDVRFPASELLRVYRETLKGLGINSEKQKNIVVDNETRPRKSVRAFCAPILIPDEIKLVIRPVGGQSDFQAMMHEAGHAQHYAWTATTLAPEFKYTGDYALTETYAFLFNHLPTEKTWLAEMLRFTDNRDFIRSATLMRLQVARRYAAKLLYERTLHSSGDLASSATLYAELQTSATKFHSGEAEFLTDLDDGFYSANYLRAWAFEVALREYLKTRFAKNWWTSRRAGNFLKEIWDTGDRYDANEMAAQIGIGPISFDLLIEEFNRELK
ncbi:MAG: hypothetical protein HY231_24910 [Acidobacteria bacterium]|nr:hypothetical protein [Acidobacteriota bacterium]